MKKNPLFLLLAISASCFLLFMIFVFFAMSSYLPSNEGSLLGLRRGSAIGVLPIEGVIADSRRTLEQIKAYEEDKNIRGVLLRVNSPGGMVAPSQEIHDAILQLKKVKPVVASFESFAASGAYYIAVATDKIVSNPGSITGSIGVIMQFMNISELYKWAKIERTTIKSGPYKDTGAENRPMTPAERALMQEMIDNVYMQFVKAVAQDRKLPLAKVKSLADGRIYTGEQALKLGMVDVLGGIEVATEELRKLANLSEKPVLVYPHPKKKRLAEIFTAGISETILSVFSRAVEQSIAPVTDGAGFLPLFMAPGFHTR